jgi:hypothetical protein
VYACPCVLAMGEFTTFPHLDGWIVRELEESSACSKPQQQEAGTGKRTSIWGFPSDRPHSLTACLICGNVPMRNVFTSLRQYVESPKQKQPYARRTGAQALLARAQLHRKLAVQPCRGQLLKQLLGQRDLAIPTSPRPGCAYNARRTRRSSPS